MIRRILPIAGLLPLAVLAHGANPVGKWSGRFVVKTPVYPAGFPAARKAQIAAQIATVQKGRMNLVLKADHTYTMRSVGLPMMGKPDKSGTWTQKGANVQLVQKGSGASHQGALVLDATGKRMSVTLGQSQARIVFTRL